MLAAVLSTAAEAMKWSQLSAARLSSFEDHLWFSFEVGENETQTMTLIPSSQSKGPESSE